MSDRSPKWEHTAADKVSSADRVDVLLNLLYEVGEDPTVRSELHALIENDAHARSRYVEAMELRTSLKIMMDEASSGVDSTLTMRRPPRRGPRPLAFAASIVASVAATLLVVFVVQQAVEGDGAAVANDIVAPGDGEPGAGPAVVQPKERVVCARVDGMSLGITEDIFAPDYLTRAGDVITLGANTDSWVRFSTNAGATLLVQGPAVGRFESPTEFVLESGRVLGEDRSPSPEKLRIRVGEAVVADLGTRFGVAVDAEQRLDVEVFDGAVAVTEGDREIVDRLDYGMGLTYEVGTVSAGGNAEPVIRRLPDQPELAKLNEMLAGIVAIDGDVRFNPFMPTSVRGGLSTDDGSIHIFEERGSFTLVGAIPVSRQLSNADVGEVPISCSGSDAAFEQATLFSSLKPLRSFLVHFENASGTRAAGFVEFDRPIVAVIGDAKLLIETDAVAGREFVSYPSAPSNDTRGVESNSAEAEPFWRDAIAVSHGRTRLNVDLIVGHGVDQMRVLVEAQ